MSSITYITGHNENIYSLYPSRAGTPKEPTPRYVSIYHDQAKEEAKAKKRTCVVLDLSGTPLKSPSNYLKKQTRSAKLYQDRSFQKRDSRYHEPHKPPLPNLTELLMAVNVSRKKINFVKENVEAVTKFDSKQKCIYYIDNPHGDRRLYNNSGLQLKYAVKKNYGKLPTYLVNEKRRNEDLQLELKKCREEETQNAQRRIRILSDEQRQKILEGLTDNWIESNSQYLELPLVLDNPGKIKTKKMLEYHLSALERDIKLLQRYNTIYVLKPKHYHNGENEDRNLLVQDKGCDRTGQC